MTCMVADMRPADFPGKLRRYQHEVIEAEMIQEWTFLRSFSFQILNRVYELSQPRPFPRETPIPRPLERVEAEEQPEDDEGTEAKLIIRAATQDDRGAMYTLARMCMDMDKVKCRAFLERNKTHLSLCSNRDANLRTLICQHSLHPTPYSSLEMAEYWLRRAYEWDSSRYYTGYIQRLANLEDNPALSMEPAYAKAMRLYAEYVEENHVGRSGSFKEKNHPAPAGRYLSRWRPRSAT